MIFLNAGLYNISQSWNEDLGDHFRIYFTVSIDFETVKRYKNDNEIGFNEMEVKQSDSKTIVVFIFPASKPIQEIHEEIQERFEDLVRYVEEMKEKVKELSRLLGNYWGMDKENKLGETK